MRSEEFDTQGIPSTFCLFSGPVWHASQCHHQMWLIPPLLPSGVTNLVSPTLLNTSCGSAQQEEIANYLSLQSRSTKIEITGRPWGGLRRPAEA